MCLEGKESLRQGGRRLRRGKESLGGDGEAWDSDVSDVGEGEGKIAAPRRLWIITGGIE